MRELHNLILQFISLIFLIIIALFFKEYPTLNKHNLLNSFRKVF
jgi:hypothetical protein